MQMEQLIKDNDNINYTKELDDLDISFEKLIYRKEENFTNLKNTHKLHENANNNSNKLSIDFIKKNTNEIII